MLVRVVNSFLQAFALLVKTDVQHELEHDRTGFGQHAFKVVDLCKALCDLHGCEPAFDNRHQHIFVLAAVENHDVTKAGNLTVNAP